MRLALKMALRSGQVLRNMGSQRIDPADKLSAAQRKIWDRVPVEWEFLPKPIKVASLGYLRLQGMIETRYAVLPGEPAKRELQWRRKTT